MTKRTKVHENDENRPNNVIQAIHFNHLITLDLAGDAFEGFSISCCAHYIQSVNITIIFQNMYSTKKVNMTTRTLH